MPDLNRALATLVGRISWATWISNTSFNPRERSSSTYYLGSVLRESCYPGKLKETHANNDKISAVHAGKACLAGTAKEIWAPETKRRKNGATGFMLTARPANE